MGNVLTFTNLIEAGVVNRNDSIGNISSLKKVSTQKGVKVFFSDKAYKRAIWNRAAEKGQDCWRKSAVSSVGGVTQRISTIIDSEEFDFAGTMIAKIIPHNRESVLVTTYGLSINNYVSCMEFLTNMALAKELGTEKTNIYNREHFHGLYKVSGLINFDRLGEQEILIPNKISVDELELNEEMSLEDFLTAFYNALSYEKGLPVNSTDFVTGLSGVIQEGIEVKLTKKGYDIKIAIDQDALGDIKIPDLKDQKVEEKRIAVSEFFFDVINKDKELLEDDKKAFVERIGKFISNVTINNNEIELSLKKTSGRKQREKIDEPPLSGNNEDMLKWLHKIYKEYLKFQVPEDEFVKLGNDRVGSLSIVKESNTYKVKISLKPEEKLRRLEILFDTICDLYRTIEGRVENLSPVFSVWSVELPNPIFHNYIDNMIKSYYPLEIDELKLNDMANGKKIFYGCIASDFKKELMNEIKSILKPKQ